MARLTRKQRASAERALQAALRARAYLLQEDVVLARPCRLAMLPEHTFTRKGDGLVFGSLNKEIGSDLAGLSSCIEELQWFLRTDGGTNPQGGITR